MIQEKIKQLLSESQTQLLSGNKYLTDKKILFGLCGVCFILIFLGLNAVLQFFLLFPRVFAGTFHLGMLFRIDLTFWFLYLIMAAASAVITVMLYYRFNISFRDLNVGQSGHSRFAALAEIKQSYLEIPEKDEPFDGIGGIVVARYQNKLYIDSRINNNFILSLTRGGKGQLEAIPMMDNLSRAGTQSSIVISDIKNGELARAGTPNLLKRGYHVRIINLTNPEKSVHLNLLSYAAEYYKRGKLSLAETLIHNIAYSLYYNPAQKDPFWTEAPIALFSAVALAHIIDNVEEHPERINMISIALFIGRMEAAKDTETEESELDKFFRSRPEYDLARMIYFTIEFAPNRTRGSVLSIAYSKLTLFCDPALADLMSTKSDFDLEGVGFPDDGKPTALFIQMPINTTKYFPVISMVFSQIYFVLSTRCLMEDQPYCKIPVKFIGDEIFNGGAIERLDNILSTCLAFKISFDLYAQSISQVEKVYGEKDANIILDNCSTKVFMMSDNKSTCERFSDLLGNYTQKDVTRSGRRLSLSKTITESYKAKPLMSKSELQELQEGEIVITQNTKRRDLSGKRISPLPIRTSGGLLLKYAYEFLPEFDTNQPIPYDQLKFGAAAFDYQSMIYHVQTAQEERAMKKREQLKAKKSDEPYIKDIPQKEVYMQLKKVLESVGEEIDDELKVSDFKTFVDDLYALGTVLSEEKYQRMKLLLHQI